MLALEITFWLSVSIVFYTYVGYPLLLSCCRFLVRRPASQASDDHRPTVSLILAAYNEEPHIRRKLENCLALDYPRGQLEILVGSDGSEDGTNQIVEEFRDRGVRLLAFSPRQGKMATVNRLVRQAQGEICVFSDISEVFDRDAVLKLVRNFADPEIGAVTGNHIYNRKNTGLGFGTALYWKLQRFLQTIESRLQTICTVDGTIYACRRELFPYPPDDTINDDMAVPLGILGKRKRVIFEPEAIARGDVLPRTGRFFHQKVRGQAGRYQVFARCPWMFRPRPLTRWLVYMSRSVFPVLVPWCLLAALLSNAALGVAYAPVYRWLFVLQAVFYMVALSGWIAERFHVYSSITALPFYFVTANIGSLVGCWTYVSGRQRAAWRKVE